MLPINLTAEKYVYQNESYIAVGVLGTRPLGILDVAAGKRNSNKWREKSNVNESNNRDDSENVANGNGNGDSRWQTQQTR